MSENEGSELRLPGQSGESLVYRYSPLRAVIINCIFLVIFVIAGLYFLPRVPQMSILFAVLTVYMLYQMFKTCSIRINLDWPELHYSYRSLFRHVDIRIPSWEITGINPEITSMWRGNISEKLVLERGEDEYLITPYYSGSDMGTARLMALVSQLPSTRQEARERVREEEEKQREAREAEGAEGHEYWVMFQASFLCTECGREIQVTGPITEFSCEKCGNVSKLDPAVWKDLLSGVSKDVTHDMQEGEGGSHRTEGPPEGHLIFGRMKPYCRKCKADLQVCDGAGEARSVRCPECGCAVRTVPPPDWFLELVPGTFMILSPDAENDERLPRSVDEQRWFAGIRIESAGN